MATATIQMRNVYDEFIATHYVTTPLRSAVHVQAVIEAAGVTPAEVDDRFWQTIRAEWLWGLSSQPFAGPNARKANARYRRHCELEGVRP
ncbi:MAG: hypothetical protein ACREJG_07830 [Candidatus Rokuibacteriota bacterium]